MKIKIRKQNLLVLAGLVLAVGAAVFFNFTNQNIQAAPAFSCQVRTGSCNAGETAVLKMSDTTNAHAEMPGQTNYNYSVCCGGTAGLGNSCSGNYDTVLKLSNVTNAHVEKKTYTNYTNSVCLSSPSPVTCSYASDCSTLGSDYTALASISADTNAHIGDASAYSTKVCCAVAPSSSCQSHNVSGYAWSENIGWISFSCKNQNNPGDYGVDISSSGNFSGYVWSENVGWINFAPSDPYPASPNYSACLDLPGSGQVCDGIGNYKVGGWARAVSYGGGWDGWIKLRNDAKNYGVSINNTTGDFSGYAWSDAVIGWIKFAGANYKVKTTLSFNNPPDKPGPDTSYGSSGVTWDNCIFQGESIPTFHWIYSDPDDVPLGTDPQTAYEIQVSETGSFNGDIFNYLVNNSAASYTLDLTKDDDLLDGTLDPGDLPASMQDYQLNWDKEDYRWRIKVKDSHNNWSEWSTPQLFKTPEEAYPYPGVSWDPLSPNQKEVVIFTPDQTGSDSYSWIVNEDTGAGYQFVDGTDILDEEPHIKFLTADNTVKLRVTRDSYFCESQEYEITANLPLPEYKETAPIIWLKRIFSSFAVLF